MSTLLGAVVYGAEGCSECKGTLDDLQRMGVAVREVDLNEIRGMPNWRRVEGLVDAMAHSVLNGGLLPVVGVKTVADGKEYIDFYCRKSGLEAVRALQAKEGGRC